MALSQLEPGLRLAYQILTNRVTSQAFGFHGMPSEQVKMYHRFKEIPELDVYSQVQNFLADVASFPPITFDVNCELKSASAYKCGSDYVDDQGTVVLTEEVTFSL